MIEDNAIPRIPPTARVIAAIDELKNGGGNPLKVVNAIHMQMTNYPVDNPIEPEDGAIVGRIMSPETFVRFLARPGLYVMPPPLYGDPQDGVFPNDVILGHKKELEEYFRRKHATRLPSDIVRMFGQAVARLEFPPGASSCWTVVADHGASDLMWRHYAGGQNGVGIKTTYSRLKSIFRDHVDEADGGIHMLAGYVDYRHDSFTRHPAFRKRPAFEPEHEVRLFAPHITQPRVLDFGPEATGSFELFFSHDIDLAFERNAFDLIEKHSADFFLD